MSRGKCATVKSAGLIFVFAAFMLAQSRTAHLEADRGQKIGNDFAKAALRALKAIESDNYFAFRSAQARRRFSTSGF